MSFHALVIEPGAAERRLLRKCLSAEGWQVSEARSAEEAIRSLDEHRWSLIFCAVNVRADSDQASGLTLLDTLRRKLGATAYIVMMGAQGGHGAPFEAILGGASDYIRKPFREIDVRRRARKVMQRLHAAKKETTTPPLAICPTPPDITTQDLELIGESEPIVNVFKKLAQALNKDYNQYVGANAKRDSRPRPPTFFITGETGTGKELVAHLIHRHSSYRSGPFVPINCSALPPDLAESELFGHEPGAFTGAVKEKKGLWELADGGTLFLDEITEAPRALLPKLLRVLQEGTVKRLGSNIWTPVNVQVIAASNRDLKAEIEAGHFRQDLYHRLSLYQFHLPPLRERREDIPLLVAHFARYYSTQPMKFSQDALDILLQYSWPGNVRELENLVRASVTQSVDGTIYALDVLARLELMGEIKTFCLTCGNQTETERKANFLTTESLVEKVKEFKLRMMKETLDKHQGNVARAASALGITRPSLYKMLKELNNENLP